ncbi:sigma factor [Microbispora bryophytorum]|uniref:sigma factor n=1 Tax=Microbispora bryophytorum TaxID=1460882 RepID=UPI0033C99204
MREPDGDRGSREVLVRVVREHAGRLAACLVSLLGDFSAAEDLVQDAVETALRRWPVEGVPDRPDAWLFTVARRRGLDVLRRETNYRAKPARLRRPQPGEGDDRLRLVFPCCHPALSPQARIALTLRVVCGLSTAQIATAFVGPVRLLPHLRRAGALSTSLRSSTSSPRPPGPSAGGGRRSASRPGRATRGRRTCTSVRSLRCARLWAIQRAFAFSR